MKIFVGADHRGFLLKNKIIRFLEKKGFKPGDLGIKRKGVICDYPLISLKVAEAVAANKGSRGILACMTGIGHSIAANKIPSIRAALCYNRESALLSRKHNDANVLIISSRFVEQKQINGIITVWLKARFEGGRHLRRVNQIKKIEKKFSR